MRFITLLVIAVLPTCAFAQSAAPSVEAQAQACMSKLLETTQSELSVRAQAITWQHDLVAAQARIKALEDKYEPKKPEEKK